MQLHCAILGAIEENEDEVEEVRRLILNGADVNWTNEVQHRIVRVCSTDTLYILCVQ